MKYITIIHQDSHGLVAEISELLGLNHINIDKINAQAAHGMADIRLFTSDIDNTLAILNESGYQAFSYENVLVCIEDKPGALGMVSRTLSESSIDIRGITMIRQGDGFNIVAITTDDDEKTRHVLKDRLVS